LDFTVRGRYDGSETGLRDALNTVERLSGIQFEIPDYHESRESTYPAHYVEVSIQYQAMFDHRNTTELNVMVDEVVADDPVRHTHSYEDIDNVSLSAYSLAEILSEKLRTLYQRARGRDYYDLYRIVSGEDVPTPEVVASIFEEKREYAPDESYHTSPNPAEGVPSSRRGTSKDDWETTLPELTSELPRFERVESTVVTYLKREIAPVVRDR
jgi:predicted nucleotidyltransferase component of viral defense system